VNDQSYTATIVVDQTPQDAFAAINNVREERLITTGTGSPNNEARNAEALMQLG
jgi:hypothetical protein